MSDLTPERPDRAIARLLAGGLTDWRDITATVTGPVTTERGRRYQQPASDQPDPTGPDPAR